MRALRGALAALLVLSLGGAAALLPGAAAARSHRCRCGTHRAERPCTYPHCRHGAHVLGAALRACGGEDDGARPPATPDPAIPADGVVALAPPPLRAPRSRTMQRQGHAPRPEPPRPR